MFTLSFQKFHILLQLWLTGYVGASLNLTEYYKMPPLHHMMEDINRCLYSTENYNVYCVVFTIIKPDNSELWHQIEVFSNDSKKHFRHDFLYSGICMRTCERQLSELTELERDDLFVEEFPWKTGRKWYESESTFKNTSKFREAYGRKMNLCVNLWLRNNYNLTGTSKIHFCNTNRDLKNIQYDHWHYIFLTLTLLIALVVIIASIYDAKRNKHATLNHYKIGRQSPLLCFSLIRNWFRLTNISKDELAQDIRFSHAVRYFATLIFVSAHMLYFYAFLPITNPEFIEQSYHNLNSVSNNNPSTVQTFFFLSGFLLYISVSEIFIKHEWNLKYCCIAVIYRYVRLVPVLAYVILFNASFLFEIGLYNGAFSNYWSETDRNFCRKNWWTNFLMINNYVNEDQMCLFVSWYISADTQLFIVTLFILMLMFKFPKLHLWIIGITFFISLVIQFTVSYVNGFDGIFLSSPETKRMFLYDFNDDYKNDFITGHMNFSSCLLGVLTALLYFYIKRRKINLGQYKSFLTFWYTIPFLAQFVLTAGAYIFYNYDFEKGVWLSLTYVFMRNIWCLICIVFFLGFVSNFESGAKRFMNWHVFTPLGRLTYSIYVCHVVVARVIYSSITTVPNRSTTQWVLDSTALFVISNIVAVVLCLCFELPMTGLAKLLLKKQKKVDNYNTREEINVILKERIKFLADAEKAC